MASDDTERQREPSAALERTLQVQTHPTISVNPAGVMVVPSEQLVFSPTETQGNAKATLSIHNPTDHSIIYKFKSNAASVAMGVSPCTGHIHPGTFFTHQFQLKMLHVKVNVNVAPQET